MLVVEEVTDEAMEAKEEGITGIPRTEALLSQLTRIRTPEEVPHHADIVGDRTSKAQTTVQPRIKYAGTVDGLIIFKQYA